MRNRSKNAFTLIELLVVTMIMGIVTAAVAACLSGGMRAWESVQSFNSLELNVVPPLQSIENELMNAVPFYDIDFAGSEQEISFPSLIPYNQEDGKSLRIGTVMYSYDATRENLLRKAWPYPDDEPDETEVVMSGIEDVRFEYFYTTELEGEKSGEWDEFRAEGTNLLSGVRVSVRGANGSDLVRTVVLPFGRTRGRVLAADER